MNYLAHAFLSFDQEDILVGNMLGDFVKGKHYLNWPKPIQQGILLHRFIDHTTDAHPLVHEAMDLFRPSFKLSNGIFVDIFFDHFLANDPQYFTHEKLATFTQATYHSLMKHEGLFDEKMHTFFSYMKEYDWLYHYSKMEGIEKSIRGICKRYPKLGDAEMALQLFEKNYLKLQQLFTDFFVDLVIASKNKIATL